MACFQIRPKGEFFFYKRYFFEYDLRSFIVIPEIRGSGLLTEFFYFCFPGFQVKDASGVRGVWLLLKRSGLLNLLIP